MEYQLHGVSIGYYKLLSKAETYESLSRGLSETLDIYSTNNEPMSSIMVFFKQFCPQRFFKVPVLIYSGQKAESLTEIIIVSPRTYDGRF